MLVAELRHDLAYTKLQYAVGKIYTSVGIDISRENIKDLSFKDYASLIKKNFNASGKKYYAKLRKPILLMGGAGKPDHMVNALKNMGPEIVINEELRDYRKDYENS